MSKTKAEIQQRVNDWNEEHEVGTSVRFWPGLKKGEPRLGVTSSEAWVLSGHAAVVKVKGYPGCISLSHVEAA